MSFFFFYLCICLIYPFTFFFSFLLAQSCEQHKCDHYFSDLVHIRNWIIDLVSFQIHHYHIDRRLYFDFFFYYSQRWNDFYLALCMSFYQNPRLNIRLIKYLFEPIVGDIPKIPHFLGYPLHYH